MNKEYLHKKLREYNEKVLSIAHNEKELNDITGRDIKDVLKDTSINDILNIIGEHEVRAYLRKKKINKLVK